MPADPPPDESNTLDPTDWPAFRAQAHRMLDDILAYVENIRDRPVWQPIPDEVRSHFRSDLPEAPSDLAAVHQEFLDYILPFTTGNVHPGFMGWVHGGGTPVGMLAEMLAAGLNANLGGRDHVPIEVERQIARWMQRIFSFPESATGLFVTGTSMANLIGVLIARDTELGFEVRGAGVAASSKRLVAYTSVAAHNCIGKAMDISGIGSDALRLIPVDGHLRIDLNALQKAIDADRRAGLMPFLVVGTAGTVDTGAIDNLDALAGICQRERLWFHVDGAYGALAILAPDLAPRLKGIERADSLAFDFHKWGQVPYDAGFILVRDGVLHRKTFAASAAYLRKELRGLAAGAPWPCDYGPDLSRAKDLVHVQSVRHRGARIDRFAHLRPSPLFGKPHRRNEGIGAVGAGAAQRGLLPLSRGGCPADQSQDRYRTPGVRACGAVHNDNRRSRRNSRGYCKPPDQRTRGRPSSRKDCGPGTRPRPELRAARGTGRGLAAATRPGIRPARSRHPHRVRSWRSDPPIRARLSTRRNGPDSGS
jgi:threonine aldolase